MARDFDDTERDFGPLAVREAMDMASFPGPEAPPWPDEINNEPLRFTANPFEWRDPTTLPRRKFLYGFELKRRQISAVVAPGAAGKTTLKIGRAICMATGREEFGHRVWNGPHRVWLWNLEDDMEEVEKTVHAFLKLWDMDYRELEGRLFVNGADSVGASGLKLAVEEKLGGGFKIQRPVAAGLIAELKRLEIDYLDIDPFVSSHSVDENSNQAIDAVAKEWLNIAQQANCAISLAHHLRKTTGAEFTAQDARGAGAMINAARSVLVLQRMSADTASNFGVADCDRKKYFSVYDDKNNKAPPALRPEWYEFVSVGLGNGDETGPEDSIGAVKRWSPPDRFAGITVRHLIEVQRLIADSPDKARKWASSARWVGHLIGKVVDKDSNDKKESADLRRMIATWIQEGALKVVEREDAQRRPREFVEVGKWASE